MRLGFRQHNQTDQDLIHDKLDSASQKVVKRCETYSNRTIQFNSPKDLNRHIHGDVSNQANTTTNSVILGRPHSVIFTPVTSEFADRSMGKWGRTFLKAFKIFPNEKNDPVQVALPALVVRFDRCLDLVIPWDTA